VVGGDVVDIGAVDRAHGKVTWMNKGGCAATVSNKLLLM
jgi:hypothetical protein